MLLVALNPELPYGYYQFMRVVVTIAAAYGAYVAFSHDRTSWVWILGIIAVLFNPIAPIHLDRETWIIPDIVAAIIMFVASAKLKHHG